MEDKGPLLRVIFLSGTILVLLITMGYLALTDPEAVSMGYPSSQPTPSPVPPSASVEEDAGQTADVCSPPGEAPENQTGEKAVSWEKAAGSEGKASAEPSAGVAESSSSAASKESSSDKSSSEKRVSSRESSRNASQPPPSSQDSAPTSTESSSEPAKPPAPSDNPPESSSSPPSPSVPSEEELAAQELENAELAAQLRDQYGIRLFLLRNASDDTDGSAVEYVTDPFLLQDGLSTCKRALSIFPQGFFEQDVTLVLANRFSSDAANGSNTFLVSCRSPALNELRGGLLDYAEEAFLSEGSYSLEEWNPPAFVYGDPQDQYLAFASSPGQGWFLTRSAQQSSQADIRQILRKALESPRTLEQAAPGTPFFQKAAYCCTRFTEWRPALSSNHAVRYFAEAL